MIIFYIYKKKETGYAYNDNEEFVLNIKIPPLAFPLLDLKYRFRENIGIQCDATRSDQFLRCYCSSFNMILNRLT